MKINQDFKEFVELLNYHKVEYLILGGYAVGFYGYPRYTGDIDFWINTTKENSEKMVNVLNDFGFASHGIKEKEFQENDQVFQLGFPPYRIDLMTSASGLSFEICFKNKKVIDDDGLILNLINIDDLKINKTTLGRANDINDIENLP